MLELLDGSTVETSPMFGDFWEFAIERHKIYMSRLRGEAYPWTDNQILGKYRFTNVFRAADRVSQALIQVQDQQGYTDEDTVFRTLLFRLFNSPDTFSILDMEHGTRIEDFDVATFSNTLDDLRSQGRTIFGGAYIIPVPGAYGARSKHENVLRLIEDLMDSDITSTVRNRSARDQYSILTSFNSIGPFMAYQLMTDFGYSRVSNIHENDFTVPGLGARRGIAKCFPTAYPSQYADIITTITHRWDDLHPEAHQVDLFGRKPTYIDVQNVFCEVDKYTRVNKETGEVTGQRMKRGYQPNLAIEQPFFPPKWGINQNIEDYLHVI